MRQLSRVWVMVVIVGFCSLSSRVAAQIQVAEALLVNLDANDPTAGTAVWTNNGNGEVGDFEALGAPFLDLVDGANAVTFNAGDAYQCFDNATAGLTGADPTRSIEVWVFNPEVTDEETLVAWGRRGGPAGTNMSFNYGLNGAYGAVGHWDFPDIGWGTVPAVGQWHHLVYTYDGTTTRVYDNTIETNSEELGPGVINTHADTRITLATQILADGVGLDFGPREGILSIARVRIHDGVLTPEQISNNFDEEFGEFNIPLFAPEFLNTPDVDEIFTGTALYTRTFSVSGFPVPTVTVDEPAGAALTLVGGLTYTLEYAVPDPAPASFDIVLTATNSEGSDDAVWTVTVRDLPQPGVLEVAEELIVDLDAGHVSAGTTLWENQGSGSDFEEFGDVVVETVAGVSAVSFPNVVNNDLVVDAYQSIDDAPAGLVGLDPTRSIEVWAYNPAVAAEETMMAWGQRGGPDGTACSFNYGNHPNFGAVTHWGGAGPDMGWIDNTLASTGAPAAGQWHHLVYTYDGSTTRVYADGVEQNSEFLGPGVINTHCCTKMVVGAQINGDFSLNEPLAGTLSLARVRVHDGVLQPIQVEHNFNEEKSLFFAPPGFVGVPSDDRLFRGTPSYRVNFSVSGFPSPTVSVLQPPPGDVILTEVRPLAYALEYTLPEPPPDSFEVELQVENENGSSTTMWTVTLFDPPGPGDIVLAGELFVELDAGNPTAGSEEWENTGTLNDFARSGEPFVEEVDGALAVTFNSDGAAGLGDDVYQSFDDAPEGLIGLDPTRSIEAWVWNPTVPAEETIVAWGRRDGPEGSNMSFNYGTHGLFGAVGHWGGTGPDLGWNDAGGAPAPGQWHLLTYTYDGTTTRVYDNGDLQNFEVLGAGAINTHCCTKITLANQIQGDGISLHPTLFGSLSIGRLRIHDGVLSSFDVKNNFLAEVHEFPQPTPPAPEFIPAPPIHRYSFTTDASDSIGGMDGTAFGDVTFADGQAVLNNDGSQNSNDPDPGAYIDLPNGMISALGATPGGGGDDPPQATFEAWVTWNGPVVSAWQRIFDFGSSNGGEDVSDGGAGQYYIYLTPRSGADTTRLCYRDGAIGIGQAERLIDGPRLTDLEQQHVVCTWDEDLGVSAMYVNGILISQAELHITLDQLIDVNNWLGRSQWADPTFAGSYNEFRVYDYALSPNQILGNFEAGPDVVNTEPVGELFVRGDSDQNQNINLTDGVHVLRFLFVAGAAIPGCLDASDADDMNPNNPNLTDGVFIFLYLFAMGAPPPSPTPSMAAGFTSADCGVDPTPDDGISCASPPDYCN